MNKYLNNKDKLVSRYSSEEIVGLLQGQVAEVLAFAAGLGRRTGLGPSEMAALEHLQRAALGPRGGLTPTQLGERLRLSSGAVTALVDRLERDGRVERRPNPEDRRSSVVYPLPSGLEEAARHLRPLAADLLEATAGLSEEERAVVGGYVEAVTKVFARHARGEDAG